jgi:hypothetical protein
MGLCDCIYGNSLSLYSIFLHCYYYFRGTYVPSIHEKGIGLQLLKTAFLEPFINHPFILYAAIKGNIDYHFNKKIKWGEMTRRQSNS